MPSSKTERARRLQMRRAFGFVLMSAVLPGSVQSFAGHRGIGRIAGRVYLAFVALALLVMLGLLLFRGPTVGLLLNPAVAGVVRVTLWVLFIGWLALLVDAWHLASPLKLGQKARLGLTATTLALALGMGGVTTVAASGFQAAGNVGFVLQGGGDIEVKAGRYNVLLLGVDGADGRDGLRPDSINVASVDAETGRTVLFGLPRNLQKVRFPLSSPLRSLYRNGYVCENNECLLNGVYTLGVEHADLYDDGVDAGLQAMKEAVGETLGLELNYYAMIDMAGFQSLINAMGGIRLNVGKPIPMGGGGSKIHGYIEPGENVHLDGYHALWFARSRAESSDYERMVRQKCVMSAMAKQLDPGTVATKFVDLSKAGQDLLSTDVGTGEVMELAELALRAKDLKITSVNFSPPLITPADPDFTLIRSTVKDKIAESAALDEANPAPTTTPANTPAPVSPAAETTGSAEPAVVESAAASESPAAGSEESPAAPAGESVSPADDVELVCSVP
ncbi:MAG: LCP family protein [Propionibacteriaceae bacterium]|nr:LCP family protein [Propionibacteriaceae bacterium]